MPMQQLTLNLSENLYPRWPLDVPQSLTGDSIDEQELRLCRRFMEQGEETLSDDELLELYLFRAGPQEDVNALAKRLLQRFGSVSGVLSAPSDHLTAIQGVGRNILCQLKLINALGKRAARSGVIGRDVISGWDALLSYCKRHFEGRRREELRIFYLNIKNQILADEAASWGTVDHVSVYPREIALRMLFHRASSAILVHNHPSGDPAPSDTDITMTRTIAAALSTLDMQLHDHLIVGGGDVVSMRALGHLT